MNNVQKINDNAAWQPIETAPKDGTEVLLASFGDIGLCYWRDDAAMHGWTWGLGKAFNGATHWMPLPPAPNAELSRSGNILSLPDRY